MHHFSRHKHILFQKWNPEIVEYYIYLIFRTIAFGLTSLFLPVFLYVDLGYSLFQIAIWFLINEFFYATFTLFSGHIVKKIGVKHAIALQLPGLAIYWYAIRTLSGDFMADLPFIVLFLFIRVGLKAPSSTADIVFTQNNILAKKHYGSSLANVKIVLIIASIISPFVGGLVAKVFGFDMFFNMAIAILLFSGIPLFMTKDKYFKINCEPRDVVNFVTHKCSKNVLVSMAGKALPDVINWAFWPVFIYIVVKGTAELGIVVSIASFVAIIVTHIIAKKIDHSKGKYLRETTWASTIVFFARSVFATPIGVTITDALNRIVNPLLAVSHERYMYKYIEKHEILKASVSVAFAYEFSCFIGHAVLAAILGALAAANIEVGYLIFIAIFALFGSTRLLMPRIIKTVKIKC